MLDYHLNSNSEFGGPACCSDIKIWLTGLIIGYTFCRLDGSTKQNERELLFVRQQTRIINTKTIGMPMIDKFNNDPEIYIFLISTLAGGTGLNLTSANKVVVFGSWLKLSLPSILTSYFTQQIRTGVSMRDAQDFCVLIVSSRSGPRSPGYGSSISVWSNSGRACIPSPWGRVHRRTHLRKTSL